jgi:hypothetical protein
VLQALELVGLPLLLGALVGGDRLACLPGLGTQCGGALPQRDRARRRGLCVPDRLVGRGSNLGDALGERLELLTLGREVALEGRGLVELAVVGQLLDLGAAFVERELGLP